MKPLFLVASEKLLKNEVLILLPLVGDNTNNGPG